MLATAKMASVAELSFKFRTSARCANHPMTSGSTMMPGKAAQHLARGRLLDDGRGDPVFGRSGEQAESEKEAALAAIHRHGANGNG